MYVLFLRGNSADRSLDYSRLCWESNKKVRLGHVWVQHSEGKLLSTNGNFTIGALVQVCPIFHLYCDSFLIVPSYECLRVVSWGPSDQWEFDELHRIENEGRELCSPWFCPDACFRISGKTFRWKNKMDNIILGCQKNNTSYQVQRFPFVLVALQREAGLELPFCQTWCPSPEVADIARWQKRPSGWFVPLQSQLAGLLVGCTNQWIFQVLVIGGRDYITP